MAVSALQSEPVPYWPLPRSAGKRERASMRDEEYEVLRQLLHSIRPERTLEVGFANGGSTEVICDVLRDLGRGKHVALDPFQNDPKHWNSRGLQRVRNAGLDGFLEWIDQPDYLALPTLVRQQQRFDFILIDGWHSFDFTMLDLFFADLLLRDGGVVAIHDTAMPAVFKACVFLERHKPYRRLGPPIAVTIPSFVGRARRRFRQITSGSKARADARRRRTQWFSLAAYRKLEHRQILDRFHAPF